MDTNPYHVLGVKPDATQDEIRLAYRNLAKKHHPDLNPGKKEAETLFKTISGAYGKISTPEDRAKFDQGQGEETIARERARNAGARQGPFYHETQAGGGRYSQQFSGFDESIFESIFSQRGGRHHSGGGAASPRGEDALYRMEIEFKDAVLGAEKEITLPNGKRLKVKIPPGVDTGSKLRFAGQGNPGSGSARSGDAYVELQVRESTVFKRKGRDLEIEIPISVSEAILGSEIHVPAVESMILLKVPPQSSTGRRLRVMGKGLLDLATGKRGDEIVVLKVVVPDTVDDEFRSAVEAWSKRQPFDPRISEIKNGEEAS